jgi:hypothetical protein
MQTTLPRLRFLEDQADDVEDRSPGSRSSHLLRSDTDDESVQRIMLAALRSEPVREPEEIFLVDRVQDRDRSPLDDLIFKGRNREWPLLSVWLWYIDTSGRQGPIRPFVEPQV